MPKHTTKKLKQIKQLRSIQGKGYLSPDQVYKLVISYCTMIMCIYIIIICIKVKTMASQLYF